MAIYRPRKPRPLRDRLGVTSTALLAFVRREREYRGSVEHLAAAMGTTTRRVFGALAQLGSENLVRAGIDTATGDLVIRDIARPRRQH